MATRIIEYGQLDTGGVPIYPPALRSQAAMTATGASAQSAATGANCYFVRIDSDEQIYVVIGTNPTATTNDVRIPAGGIYETQCGVGQKIAIRT